MKNYIKHALYLLEKHIGANKIKFSEIELLDYDDQKEVPKSNKSYVLCIFPYLVSYNFQDVV